MRTKILETINRPNYFRAEVCTCADARQLRLIIWYCGGLVWTQRCWADRDLNAEIERLYKQCLHGGWIERHVA